MSDEQERGDEEKPRNFSLTPGAGECVVIGEGLTGHAHGPTRDALRTSDSRGWTAGADIGAGAMSGAVATGIPSHNEDLTLDSCRFLIRRLNRDGATWEEPVERDQRTGGGVDAEARDARDQNRRLLMNVTRAEVDEEFWKRLYRESRSDLAPSTVEEAAHRIWVAIEGKRNYADPDVVLVLNAIRTPWLALPPIVDAFRRTYGAAARAVGFQAVWIVGATDAFVERLDT
jgi:hypothetical protein